MARTITEKENVLRVMTGNAMPQWIPVGMDCLQMCIPTPMRERPKPGETQDWFNCNWVPLKGTIGWAIDMHQPYLLNEGLKDWREKLVLPDLDAIDWDAAAKQDLANVDRDAKALRLFVESGPMERCYQLMGMTQTFFAMADDPEEFKSLIDALASYKIDLFNHMLPAYKPDEVFCHNDVGSAHGQLISMDMYRKIVKPADARICKTVHAHGAIHNQHSCGFASPFYQDMLDFGADMVNSVQRMNDRKAVAKAFGNKLAYEVIIDSVNDEFCSEKDIVQEVHDVIDIFGPTGRLLVGTAPSDNRFIERAQFAHDEVVRYGADFYCK